MKRTGIPLKGFRLDRHGKLVRDQRRLPVNLRLQQQTSKRVRVAKRTTRR
jgi:hypothetical protein